MKVEKKVILHLQKTGVSEQAFCIVKGCHCYQEPYAYSVKSGLAKDYYVLCRPHRKLAKDRYLGNVPDNYVPSRDRYIYPDNPRCSVKDCNDYCQSPGVDQVTSIRKYYRWCSFHLTVLNRTVQKKMRYANLNLPLPPLEEVRIEDIAVICEVPGCGKECCRQRNRKDRNVFFNKRCQHHRQLKRRGLPDDYRYVQPPSKRLVREKCIVVGCSKLQANKGLLNGQVMYSRYCEGHRRGRFAVEKKGRVKMDTKKCSLCGWVGPCDKHRVLAGKDGGRYVPGNVIVVCPNCHRLEHLKNKK
jgi:hypothetical protein